MWATLGNHVPALTAITMVGGFLARFLLASAAVLVKSDARRRAALEGLRLLRRDARKIPSYYFPPACAGRAPQRGGRRRPQLPQELPAQRSKGGEDGDDLRCAEVADDH